MNPTKGVKKMFTFKIMDLVPKKKSTVVRRVQVYSYFPCGTDEQIALRRNIRERLVVTR
jgi:hypothetical protein